MQSKQSSEKLTLWFPSPVGRIRLSQASTQAPRRFRHRQRPREAVKGVRRSVEVSPTNAAVQAVSLCHWCMITWFATGSLLQDLMWKSGCGGFDLVRLSVEPIGAFGMFPK